MGNERTPEERKSEALKQLDTFYLNLSGFINMFPKTKALLNAIQFLETGVIWAAYGLSALPFENKKEEKKEENDSLKKEFQNI